MLVFIDGPLYQRGDHMLVFKMVSFIREVAAMLGKMQISFKERAGCTFVFINDALYWRGGCNGR